MPSSQLPSPRALRGHQGRAVCALYARGKRFAGKYTCQSLQARGSFLPHIRMETGLGQDRLPSSPRLRPFPPRLPDNTPEPRPATGFSALASTVRMGSSSFPSPCNQNPPSSVHGYAIHPCGTGKPYKENPPFAFSRPAMSNTPRKVTSRTRVQIGINCGP